MTQYLYQRLIFNPSFEQIEPVHTPVSYILNKNSYKIAEMFPQNVEGIHCWYFNKFKNAKTILFCHGNKGSISNCSYMIEFCHAIKINLLLFDYSGFGCSNNMPSSNKIIKSAVTTYDFLTKIVDKDDIIVWGHSLGGYPAINLATKRDVKYLVLFSVFTSITDVFHNTYRFSSFSKSIINMCLPNMIDTMDNCKNIKKIKCPVVIIHSKDDDVIDYEKSKQLYDYIPTRKLFIPIKGKHITPEINCDDIMN